MPQMNEINTNFGLQFYNTHDVCSSFPNSETSALSNTVSSSLSSQLGGYSLLSQRGHDMYSEKLRKLLDAAVRHAIGPTPKRHAGAVQIAGQESFKQLVDIAPSLWIPKYLFELSSRSVFLPTISHALANLGSSPSTDLNLKFKILELAKRSAQSISSQQDNMTNHEIRNVEPIVRDCISVQLWRTMQHKLVVEGATNQLLPLFDPLDVHDASDDNLSVEPELDILSNGHCESEQVERLDEPLSDDAESLLGVSNIETCKRYGDSGEHGCSYDNVGRENCNSSEEECFHPDEVEEDLLSMCESNELPMLGNETGLIGEELTSESMDWDLSSSALHSEADDILQT